VKTLYKHEKDARLTRIRHQANEWSLMLNGSVRLVSSNEAGEVFEDDLQAGGKSFSTFIEILPFD